MTAAVTGPSEKRVTPVFAKRSAVMRNISEQAL